MAQPDDCVNTLRAVAHLALREWDLEVTAVELISVSENTVFKVETQCGESLVLRVHRPGYHTLDELLSEQLWTAALNEAGVSAPVPRHAADGRGYVSIRAPGTDTHYHVGLAEWVDGKTLNRVIKTDASEATLMFWFERLGQLAARIHNTAVAWPIPKGFQRHALDAHGLMGEAPFWGPFWVLPQLRKAERQQILHARTAIYRILSDYGKTHGTYSLIHADLHPGNLLVHGDQLHIIDFDDTGFGWHPYELAVALFSYWRRPAFEAIHEALIRGYRAVRAFDDVAVELVRLFILVRALALLGWCHERPELDHGDAIAKLIELACTEAAAWGVA